MNPTELRNLFKIEGEKALLFNKSSEQITAYQYTNFQEAPYNTLLFNLEPFMIQEGNVFINVERYSLFTIVHPDTLVSSNIKLQIKQKDSLVLYFESMLIRKGEVLVEEVGRILHVTTDFTKQGILAKVNMAKQNGIPLITVMPSIKVTEPKFNLVDLLYGQVRIQRLPTEEYVLSLAQQYVLVYKVDVGEKELIIDPYVTIPFLLGANRGIMDTDKLLAYIG